MEKLGKYMYIHLPIHFYCIEMEDVFVKMKYKCPQQQQSLKCLFSVLKSLKVMAKVTRSLTFRLSPGLVSFERVSFIVEWACMQNIKALPPMVPKL